MLTSFGWATTTVTGHIQNLGTSGISSGAFVRFWLRGCNGNQPTVTGAGIIGPSQGGVFYFDIAAGASGAVSGTIYSTRDATGNLGGDISCGGSTTAVWYGMQIFQNGKGGPETAIHAKSGTTLDITSVTPITTNPIVTAPTGDTTYARLDTGNQPFLGSLTPSTNGIFNLGSSANRWNAYLKGADISAANTLDQIKFVDGILYITVQAAINALPATGGWVFVPPGIFAGPTSIPSNTHIIGYQPGVTSATWNAATNFVGGTSPADAGKTTFTYSANQTFSSLWHSTIENVTFDFQGSNAGLILGPAVFDNTFDIVIQNCGTGTALTLSGGSVAGQSVALNDFRRLQIYNAGKGLVLTAASPGVAADNNFDYLVINNVSTRGIEFTQQSDTNTFNFTFIAGLANTANAITFNNSGTPTLDVDADDNTFRHLLIDAMNPPSYTGTLLQINDSIGNLIQGLTVGGGMNASSVEVAIQGLPSYTLEYAGDLTNGTNSNTVHAKRFIGSGTKHTSSDFNLTGWGSGFSTANIFGTDAAGTLNIVAGSGPSGNPTVILTFRDGVWGAAGWGSNNPTCVVSRGEHSAPTTAYWEFTGSSTTQATFTFVGTPQNGNSYTMSYICVGSDR